MRVALPNRARPIENAAHAAGHHDVAEDEVGRRDIGKHFEGMVRVGRQQSFGDFGMMLGLAACRS